MELKDALLSLDTSNDNHWTQDGLPRLETLRMLVSNSSLSRDDVSSQFPGFSRNNFSTEAAVAEADVVDSIETTLTSSVVVEDALNEQSSEEQLPAENEEVSLAKQISLVEREIAEAQSRLINLQLAQDSLIVEQEIEHPQAVIQQYLAASRRILQNRGVKMKLIADSGIDLKQLASDLKSPLDASFAKRRK